MASKYGIPCSLGTNATLTWSSPPPPAPPPPSEAEPPLPWPQPEATRANARPATAASFLLRIILTLISSQPGSLPSGGPGPLSEPWGGPVGLRGRRPHVGRRETIHVAGHSRTPKMRRQEGVL